MLKRLFFALVPALLLFGVTEMVLRVMGWPEVTQAFEHNEPFWVVDPDLKDHPMPHNEENTSFAVFTNSDGLRQSVIPKDTFSASQLTGETGGFCGLIKPADWMGLVLSMLLLTFRRRHSIQ